MNSRGIEYRRNVNGHFARANIARLSFAAQIRTGEFQTCRIVRRDSLSLVTFRPATLVTVPCHPTGCSTVDETDSIAKRGGSQATGQCGEGTGMLLSRITNADTPEVVASGKPEA